MSTQGPSTVLCTGPVVLADDIYETFESRGPTPFLLLTPVFLRPRCIYTDVSV